MEDERILLASPHMSEEGYEENYIQEAFQTNWIAPLGNNVNQFEVELKQYVSSDEAVALVSGTAAIHLGLRYLGVTYDDIVLVSSLTFAASANPICYLGAKPVFIDSEADTWNMCPKALEKALVKYPNAKAIVTVNLYGQNCKYDEIIEIAGKFNVPILEDAAESLGSTYKDRMSGTLGDIGIFSFNGNKIITTSGGGMLVSNKKGISDKVKFWATQSREDVPYYLHKELGFNYRMSNVVAGIGRGQLRVLEERVNKKKEIFENYKKAFENIEIEMQPIQDFGTSNYWLSCMTINNQRITPEMVINALSKHNIEARHIWNPLHTHPYFEGFDFIKDNDYSIAEDIFNRGVCLPSDTKMTYDQQQKVIKIIVELFGEYKNV